MKNSMGIKNISFCALLATAPLMLLAPSIAQAESKPAPAKQWADPGAAEKAKTDSATQGQAAPAAAVPAKPAAAENKPAPEAAATHPAADKKPGAHADHEKPEAVKEHKHGANHKANPANEAKEGHGHKKLNAITHHEEAKAEEVKAPHAHSKAVKPGKTGHGGKAAVGAATEPGMDLPDPLSGL